VFVAVDTTENKIVGMLLVDVGRDTRTNMKVGKVINFIVDPNYQGKGIGSKLLEQAIEYSMERKATVIRVNARRQLENTVQLFRKFGFDEVYMVMEREL
ncbi:MAG TPA: GNAT family N-acetyltransferase, partial [Candidatus Deferrimicrobium sp.]|nr:GNAT family N-acetyltransferase [Candidatus Deferrimicrobium sp.]